MSTRWIAAIWGVFLVPTLVSLEADSYGEANMVMSKALVASVSVDRSLVRLGDGLHIAGVLRNMSSRAVVVKSTPHVHAAAHVIIKAQDGTELTSYVKRIVDRLYPYQLSDFTEMRSGDEVTMSFRGELGELTLPDLRQRGRAEVNGVFLDFGTSAILIPADGVYNLHFEIEYSRVLSGEVETALGLRNVWYGRVESKPVQLEIKR